MSSTIDNLFGSVENVDSNVSKLFSTSTGPVREGQIKTKGRTVLPDVIGAQRDDEQSEKSEGQSDEQSDEAAKEKSGNESESIVGKAEDLEEPAKKKHKRPSKNDEDDQLEERYFSKLQDDAEEEEKLPAKDGLKKDVTSKAKKIDLKEDELEKAERTLFVGNLSNNVITSKDAYKKFKKLFSTNPEKKDDDGDDDKKHVISSIRFRSISFEEALPRKVAFAQSKLHKSRDSVNAYIVYNNPNVVKQTCKKLNGHEFMSRHLRVDSVTHPAPHDNKRSIFVGNLDFEEDEESLWLHFKSCGDIEYVRIVRDAKTNVGKGFAYVQFEDFQCVNKALLLNDKPMKSVKTNGKSRKLRISRCKNIRKQNTDGVKARAVDSSLHDSQKTKIGRAKKILGKADKATVGQQITIEGLRAKKSDGSSNSILKRKKQRSKTGRVTKRSQAFRKSQASSK